jgi:hypothetical protein
VRLRKSAAAQIEGSIEAEVREKENSMQQGTGSQNKRVVILGGSSGIGLAVVEQEASQGARTLSPQATWYDFRRRLRRLAETRQDNR